MGLHVDKVQNWTKLEGLHEGPPWAGLHCHKRASKGALSRRASSGTGDLQGWCVLCPGLRLVAQWGDLVKICLSC